MSSSTDYKTGRELALLYPERKIAFWRLWAFRLLLLGLFLLALLSTPPRTATAIISLLVTAYILGLIYFAGLYVLSNFDDSIDPEVVFDNYSGRFDEKLEESRLAADSDQRNPVTP